MTTDSRMPLREAATTLAGYPRFRKTRSGGKREPFKLLQGQEMQAAFDFPSEARPDRHPCHILDRHPKWRFSGPTDLQFEAWEARAIFDQPR